MAGHGTNSASGTRRIKKPGQGRKPRWAGKPSESAALGLTRSFWGLRHTVPKIFLCFLIGSSVALLLGFPAQRGLRPCPGFYYSMGSSFLDSMSSSFLDSIGSSIAL